MAKIIQLRRHGHTDAEWFGPVLDKIQELREAVNEYFESISSKPPRLDKEGNIVGLSPDGVVEVLETAVNTILAMQLNVPAITELFLEKRYADLMDVLLPDAPQQYRDDCVQLILEAMNSDDVEPEEPEEEDEVEQ